MQLSKILSIEEGFRAKPYLCSEGYVTIGIGTKLHNSKGMNPKDFPVTVTPEQAALWLEADVERITRQLESSIKGDIFSLLDQDRQNIIISMAYQMGVQGVLKFKRMWYHLAKGQYQKAANEAMDSRWARQTPIRAARHSSVLSGEDIHDVYASFL